MTCDKCEDIHEAQRCGKTQEECKCTCHGTILPNPYPWTNPFVDPCCPDITPWYPPCYPPYSPIWQVFPNQLPTCRLTTWTSGGNPNVL